MNRGIAIGSRRISPGAILWLLAGLVVILALVSPEGAGDEAGDSSSFSTGRYGMRMAYELAQRMGWRTGRRETPLDSEMTPSVQVVIAPDPLGAVEVHRLLDNVRRGGGLLFDVQDGAIADSLGVRLSDRPQPLLQTDPDCHGERLTAEDLISRFRVTVNAITWSRPAPAGAVPIVVTNSASTRRVEAGVGFPLGAGRVVAVGMPELFVNTIVRICSWGADVAVARSYEYLAGDAAPRERLVFDEYHHGYGAHGGSFTAMRMYLAGTGSGRFLAEGLVAGLLLLFAAAPRPIVPKEPERIVRRSPLEHAEALGNAYADVGATKTATVQLVAGLRRRAGRLVAAPTSASDVEFLDAAVARSPSLAQSAAVIKRALREAGPVKEFSIVGDAVREMERTLLTSSPTSS